MDRDGVHIRSVLQQDLTAPLTSRPPRTRPDCLRRERLLRRLDAGAASALTLVTAPAGFGKTTLLAQWAAGLSLPVAWITVREQHADARTLFTAITLATQRLFPATAMLPDSSRLLRHATRAPSRYVASTLVRELCEAPEEYVLVIDDFHFVGDDRVLDVISELVCEAGATLHLVLAARADPSLPLERLRASGELTEIRAAALQFTPEEVEAFLTTPFGASASRAVAGEATLRTEGWITGLRLALLAVQSDPRPEMFLACLRASGGRHVMGYLVCEVLAQQPIPIQDFLLRASLFDQFSGALCDAVVESGEAQVYEILEEIERRSLFLSRVDDQGDWYRYHALFQQLLQHELLARYGPGEVARLHRKASQWFAQHGMIDEALRHTLSIQEYETASSFIEGQMQKALNEQRWRDLQRWLKHMPDAIVQERPALLIAQAVVHSIQHRLRAVPPLLRRATELLRTNSGVGAALPVEVLYGTIDALWAQDLYHKGQSAAGVHLAARALAALPTTAPYARGSAIMWSALLKQVAGKEEHATQWLEQVIDTDESPSVTARALLALCVITRFAGRLDQCQAAAERLLVYAQRHDLPLDITWARHFLGWIAYERNQLDAACEHLLAVSEQRYFATATAVCDSLSILALTFQAQGRATAAEETLQDLSGYAVELNHTFALDAVAALRARLAVARDDLLTAQAMFPWLKRPGSPPAPMLWILPPGLVQARILVALDGEEHWRRAVERLAELEQFAQATHDRWRVYIIRSLQAAARFRLGQRAEALSRAQETLSAARPHGFIRAFADCGTEFAHLLRALQLQPLPPGLARYIDDILAAYAPSQQVLPQQAPSTEMASPAPQWKPRDSLTAREIEVLRMLNQRLTDKEIADALVISTYTVQAHTRNIYRKLEVGDRREAAVKARALGLVHQAGAPGPL
jgi:LuxR family maltose regulon positive regulatory protein